MTLRLVREGRAGFRSKWRPGPASYRDGMMCDNGHRGPASGMGIGDGGRVLQVEDGRVGTIASRTWPFAPSWGWRRGGEPRLTKWLAAADCWVRVAAMAGIVALFAVHHALPVLEPDAAGLQEEAGGSAKPVPAPNERFFAFYISQPFYDRSDVHFVRSDETDVVFKQMGWDGDALMPPIDGGVRVVKWRQNFGFMIDFLHNKAVSRLGKGAHGREISNPVIETVEATGRIAGAPAPPKVKLTDFFERFEFTHGHNVLIATPLVRFAEIVKGVRPYAASGPAWRCRMSKSGIRDKIATGARTNINLQDRPVNSWRVWNTAEAGRPISWSTSIRSPGSGAR